MCFYSLSLYCPHPRLGVGFVYQCIGHTQNGRFFHVKLHPDSFRLTDHMLKDILGSQSMFNSVSDAVDFKTEAVFKVRFRNRESVVNIPQQLCQLVLPFSLRFVVLLSKYWTPFPLVFIGSSREGRSFCAIFFEAERTQQESRQSSPCMQPLFLHCIGGVGPRSMGERQSTL